MTVRAIQEAMLRALFGPELDPADAAALVDPRIPVYRDLARGRVMGLLRTALPRSLAALAEPEAAMSAFLAEGPTRTRFLRDVPLLFADRIERSAGAPELADLVRLERARWWAMIAEERAGEVAAFDLGP